eukprot:scaffold24028_cov152-Cylindrotheca_fusiformis.AAC.7
MKQGQTRSGPVRNCARSWNFLFGINSCPSNLDMLARTQLGDLGIKVILRDAIQKGTTAAMRPCPQD